MKNTTEQNFPRPWKIIEEGDWETNDLAAVREQDFKEEGKEIFTDSEEIPDKKLHKMI